MNRFGLVMGLLGFLSEAEKLILLNGFVLGWLGLKTELKELMHRLGLAMGLLSFLSKTEKSILPRGLALGWLGFLNQVKGVDA